MTGAGAINEFAGRGATQKNGRQPEGAGRSNSHMLKVAEQPDTGKADVSQFMGFSEDHRAALWLDGEVKKGKKALTTQVVELTPALARVLLERNPGNRHLSDVVVESYARDIEHGLWQFNGESVVVADDGLLNDGQHRCAAVIRAEKAIPIVLVIGARRATRETLDQGRTRTASDYLAMRGLINTNQLAAATGFIWQHRLRGAIWSSGKPTKSEIVQMVDEYPSIRESVNFVQIKGADAYGGRSMLAFCHWTFWHAYSDAPDRATADTFVVALVQGAGLSARSPILYCRNRLVTERGRLRTNDRAELLFRTWNAWRRNETPRTLPILGGVLPVVEK